MFRCGVDIPAAQEHALAQGVVVDQRQGDAVVGEHIRVHLREKVAGAEAAHHTGFGMEEKVWVYFSEYVLLDDGTHKASLAQRQSF